MLKSKGHARGGIVLSCIVLAVASVASAAEFNWAPTAASSPGGTFSYDIGKNIGTADLYGNPLILDSGFQFNSTQNFSAVGGGGIAGLANNLASTRINALGGIGQITEITIREFGTWSAPGGEAPQDIFNFTLILGLAPIFPSGLQQFAALSNTIIFNPDGTWTAEGTLIPSTNPAAGGGAFFTIGSVTAENILGVDQLATAGSTFSKLGSTVTIPEPTTVALLLAGLTPLALRRRRRRNN